MNDIESDIIIALLLNCSRNQLLRYALQLVKEKVRKTKIGLGARWKGAGLGEETSTRMEEGNRKREGNILRLTLSP